MDVAAGFLGSFASMGGLLVGLFLSIVKFRSDFTCDKSYFSACEVGSVFSCDRAFNSAWSSFGGLPVTMYATAFYAVALVVSLGLAFHRRPLYGSERRFVLLFGWLSVGVSVAMAAYAKIALGAVCLYCFSLYLVSVLFFICALQLSGEGLLSGLAGLLRPWWATVGAAKGAVTAASIFILALVPQAWAYHQARTDPALITQCTADASHLPPTDLVMGDSRPDWIFAAFMDPSCRHCRAQHRKLEALLDSYPGRLQIRIYHYPREDRCAPPGFAVRTAVATVNGACLASLASQCVARLDEDKAPAYLARVLALQDTPSPMFTRNKLRGAATELGLDDEAVSRCLHDDKAALDQLHRHMLFGQRAGLMNTPRVYAIPVIDGDERPEAAIRFEGDKDVRVFERLLEQPQRQPSGAAGSGP